MVKWPMIHLSFLVHPYQMQQIDFLTDNKPPCQDALTLLKETIYLLA